MEITSGTAELTNCVQQLSKQNNSMAEYTTREYTIRLKLTAGTGSYHDREQSILEQVINNLDTVSDERGWGQTSSYQSKGVLLEDGLEWMYEWHMDETNE